MEIDPRQLTTPQLQALLQGAITPRPIALASTIDKKGNVNLSPFSFFNMFGTNPPILIFSPARRVRDNTIKHTLENVMEIPEVVIHIVNSALVQQVSLASTEYPKGVNEFIKAGLTQKPSITVKPPRVAEAPVALECKVVQIIPMGKEGGAGNLVLCEVIFIHVNDDVMDGSGKIDPFKLDAIARLGGDWYCRVHAGAIFSVAKPLERKGIGVDQLPDWVRLSKVLTGNDLGMLGNVEQLPDMNDDVQHDPEFLTAFKLGENALHRLAQQYLKRGEVTYAWNILLAKRKA